MHRRRRSFSSYLLVHFFFYDFSRKGKAVRPQKTKIESLFLLSLLHHHLVTVAHFHGGSGSVFQPARHQCRGLELFPLQSTIFSSPFLQQLDFFFSFFLKQVPGLRLFLFCFRHSTYFLSFLVVWGKGGLSKAPRSLQRRTQTKFNKGILSFSLFHSSVLLPLPTYMRFGCGSFVDKELNRLERWARKDARERIWRRFKGC